MASSRTIIVAGAGIGGLTAALALARKGFRIVVCEHAPELSETGAGLQLSPNVARLLIELDLAEKLQPHVVAPELLSVRRARTGGEITRMQLGREIAFRYGAPYWIIHRADLQAVLRDAVLATPDIVLQLGVRVQDFATHQNGVTVQVQRGDQVTDERAVALIGADGLWSVTRRVLGDASRPRFSGRTAWRATVLASAMPEEFRAPAVHLWLGRGAHLVHYPVRAGALVNIVAIVGDAWQGEGWSLPGAPDDLLRRFGKLSWSAVARSILQAPDSWLKWALFDRPALRRWGHGNATLLGDAAHPMMPFLAQGAAMAIEDAMVLADCLASDPENVSGSLRRYESLRRGRTARVQRAARFTGEIYHLDGPLAVARNMMLQGMGSENLRARYDWLYDWRRR
ncbi:MAG: FAD-dependent monooxygenase [Pseudorhodoplanes sp.]|nr:FAD-dependent monooxygenase [Pseudorhodoplanes sp.]